MKSFLMSTTLQYKVLFRELKKNDEIQDELQMYNLSDKKHLENM